MKNNYNKIKKINRQKFNAIWEMAFCLGKNDDWKGNMRQIRDDYWEETK